MKFVKAFFAVIFSLLLLLCCTWFLAAGAVSHILERDVLSPVLAELPLDSLVENVMSGSLTDLDDLSRSLMSTDAVTDYISDFIRSYAEALVFQDPEPEVTGESLSPVMEEAIEELLNSGTLSAEDSLILAGMQLVVPQLSGEIAGYVEAAIPSRAELLSQLGLSEELLSDLLYLIGPSVRNILLGFSVFSALIIFLLYLKRGGGLIWNGVLFAFIGVVFAIGGIVLGTMLRAPLAAYGITSLAGVVQNAFLVRGGIVCVVGVVLLLIGVICRTFASKPAVSRPRHGG